VEESVVLPELPAQTGLLIGVAAAAGLLLLGIQTPESCDHADCGAPVPTTTTGTR